MARTNSASSTFRFEEAIYVLHAFVKKTGTTRKADIDLGKARYAAMLEARKSRT